MSENYLIVVPTYNEAQNIELFLDSLSDVSSDILVVDDIYDSGYTMNRVMKFLSNYAEARIQGFCLFGKKNNLNIWEKN